MLDSDRCGEYEAERWLADGILADYALTSHLLSCAICSHEKLISTCAIVTQNELIHGFIYQFNNTDAQSTYKPVVLN